MLRNLMLAVFVLAVAAPAQAQSKLPDGAAAMVNGVAISAKALDLAVQSV